MTSHATLRALLAPITTREAGRITTHYETCYQWHVGCLAALVSDLLPADAEPTPATITADSHERWYVPCGCSVHAGVCGCVHPVGVEVTAPTEAESDRRAGKPVVPQGAATPADETAHYVVAVGHSSRIGPYVVCACEADRFGEGPRISGRDYPAHLTLAASPADADTAELDSAVGIIEGVQHALALTRGARATAEERVYTTEANRLIHEKRERMLQARLTDGTTAGRTYARTGGDEHATTPPVAAAVKRPLIAVPVCGHPGCEFMVRQFEHSTTWNHLDTHGVPVDHEATPPVAAIDLPGFEGTRSALDALITRKAKTDD